MENNVRVPEQIIVSILLLMLGGFGAILFFFSPASEIIRVGGIYILSTFSAFLAGTLWETGVT